MDFRKTVLRLRAIDRADRWPEDVRLFDIEGRFTCTACG
jgi:hypothetical protein